MRNQLVLSAIVLFSLSARAQDAAVDVTLFPAGSFTGTTSEVKGFAVKRGDAVEASNIAVSLKNLKTGIKLRDSHTQKYLETSSHPEALLVSAKGMNGKGEGVIRIKGIEKKIAGTYSVEGSMLKAEFPIKFSDFNIKNIAYMGVGVQDEGKIKISVPLKSDAKKVANSK
jgi:CxxC motif-containing protein